MSWTILHVTYAIEGMMKMFSLFVIFVISIVVMYTAMTGSIILFLKGNGTAEVVKIHFRIVKIVQTF